MKLATPQKEPSVSEVVTDIARVRMRLPTIKPTTTTAITRGGGQVVVLLPRIIHVVPRPQPY
ncbi:MAG TPA: hypothetical protein VNL71_08575, partial [Chloroflexota bacterium]|nr:hypothetical protein [Chloroflexota bacterium]